MNPQINTVLPKHRSSWFTPAQCLSYYKVPYQFREIQIHWWGDPATKPSHNGVVNYIANKTGGSVNYVASAGRVTKMLGEENCALTTQNGNPYGIKIECSPYCTNGDYQTVAWLIADIWKRRGKMPLTPHKKYWNTACPGNWDLIRLTREAEQIIQGGIVMNYDAGVEAYRTVFHREPENNQVPNQWNGQSPQVALNRMRGTEWEILDQRLGAYQGLVNQVSELSSRPTKAELEAVVNDANLKIAKIAELEQKLAEEQARVKEVPVGEEVAVRGFFGRIIDFLINRFKK